MGLDISFHRGKKTDNPDEVNNEIAYMRKHNWLLPFFHYYDNCTMKEISKAEIEIFIDNAEKILNTPKEERQNVAEAFLPTTNGFFFGSTAYDEDYFNCLENDINQFKNILESTDFNTENIWMHCWW